MKHNVNLYSFGSKIGGKLSKLPLTSTSGSSYGSGMPSKGVVGIYTAAFLYYNTTSGLLFDRTAFCGKKGDTYYAEIREIGLPTQICVLENANPKVAFYDDGAEKITSDFYEFGRSARNSSVVFLAAFMKILEDKEAEDIYAKMGPYLQHHANDSFWDDEENCYEFNTLLCKFSDNVYQRNRESKIIEAPSSGRYKKVSIADLKVSEFDIACGEPHVFKTGAKVAHLTLTASDYQGKFALPRKTKYTAAEEMMIPKIPKEYNLPEYVIKDAEMLNLSSNFKTPMRNVMYAGPAGTGKTESARMLCALLDLPYTKTTCSVDTDSFSLLGQVYPNMNADHPISYEDYLTRKGLPSPIEIECDPQNSYQKITGNVAPSGVDATECYSLLVAKILEEIQADCQSNKDLIYVESDLIKAIRYGYGHEIQEPTVIKRAGVLVGLNALLENGEGAFITLPTGEVVKKHPNCTIILTTNTDYEGCANINQSVLSRMDIVEHIEAPDRDEIEKRIVFKTGFNNPLVLSKMIKVIGEIGDVCTAEQITDGSVGMRELENWVKAVMIQCILKGEDMTADIDDSIIYSQGIKTVISKSSQTEEDRERLLTVLENTFSA